MIKRILVALGGTRYTPFAVARGLELAREHGASLTGVTVVDTQWLAPAATLTAAAAERAETLLAVAQEHVDQAADEFLAACRAAGVACQVRQEQGDAFTLMAHNARYHDLMIFGLRSLFEYNLVPQPHDALVRLMTAGVRPLLAVAADQRPIERILVAYSGSQESADAIKSFAQSGLWPRALLRVVTFQHAVEEAEQLVGDAAEYCRAHGFNTEEAYSPHSPKDHLLPYAAEWGADLIVAGNSAKGLLRRRVLGETALNLMTGSDRPLFLSQ